MSRHEVKADNGKYTFVIDDNWDMNILRHGEPWCEVTQASKAIHSMMAELDAARVVVAAARRTVDIHHEGIAPIGGLRDALEKHSHLVDDREPPSAWATK